MPTAPAVNVGARTSAGNNASAAAAAAKGAGKAGTTSALPSITVEILGYGGGEATEDDVQTKCKPRAS